MKEGETRLAIDIGTNGEMVLAFKGKVAHLFHRRRSGL